MMTVLGVIAEYNPFHLGHRYHLAQAQRQTGADATVAIMSGHFTQRGEPAIVDKWLRTRMALSNGVDLVLELPTVFACRSAYYFALGAVLSLAETQVVTHLAFGSEATDLTALSTIADLLATEPLAYQATLKHHLHSGLAFPRAQQLAITELLGPMPITLNQPNTILALNYLQIIKSYQLPLEAVAIQRQGDYHSLTPAAGLASASAIRQRVLRGDTSWQAFMPTSCTALLTQHLQNLPPVEMANFTQGIFTILRRTSPTALREIIETGEGLENKILRAAEACHDLDTLCASVKSKRYTYTRIQRLLCHILLNFTHAYAYTKPYYLRILGFNATGEQLLRDIKKRSQLPLITKVAAARRLLDEDGQQMLAMDCRATSIYHLALGDAVSAQGGRDFYNGPVILR